jgi:uncharacterized protein YndB with AHSA1/START domain
MERKTKVNAEEGTQDIVIIREFDLSVELLFKAYTEPDLVEQWMGTKVLKLESKKHGVIHEFILNHKITRTFEFEDMPHGVQLELLQFEKLGNHRSKLNIHTIYESAGHREQALKLPFAQGINMAHNRLQEIASNLK